jgi:putative membrane protein
MTAAPEARFDVQPTVANHLSWVNTVLSLQRTLMAATRTAVSLIGFGFTVAQFFTTVMGSVPEEGRLLRPEGPRNLGLALIGAGVISLAIFAWQYRTAVRRLRTGVYQPLVGDARSVMYASVYIVTGAVLLIGVAAFVTVFMRL